MCSDCALRLAGLVEVTSQVSGLTDTCHHDTDMRYNLCHSARVLRVIEMHCIGLKSFRHNIKILSLLV